MRDDLDRGLDIARVFRDQPHDQAVIFEQAPVQFFDHGQHVLLDADHIGPGLASDREIDHGFAVDIDKGARLKAGLLDPADVPQPDKGLAPAGDHEVLDLFDAVETAARAQQVATLAEIQIAARDIAVAGADGVPHIGQAQRPFSQPDRVHEDPDLPPLAAKQADRVHPRRAFQKHQHIVLQEIPLLSDIDSGGIAGQRLDAEIHKRIGGEGTGADARLIHILGIPRHLAHGVVDPDQRFVEVRAMREFEFDLGPAGAGRRDHAREARYATQVLLLLDQDFLFNVLRAGPGPAGLDRDHARVQIRDHLHRRPEKGEHAKDGDDQYRHRDDNGFMQRKTEHGPLINRADQGPPPAPR